MIWDSGANFPDATRYYQVFEYMFVLSKGTPRVFKPMTKPNKSFGRKVNRTDRNVNGFTTAASGNGASIKPDGVLPNVWF
ncbi:hypothetical protein, partial [Streptococcus pneumoniae]|uniref:hypothetical protein n=1 Tax=Streptococcus pneumoniae TaxID=1313 RepID=UPI001E3E5D8C